METFLVHLYYTQIPSSYQTDFESIQDFNGNGMESVTGKSQKDLLNI